MGKKAIAAGWGTLKENGKPSCELQEVEVPVISNDDCRKTNYSSKMISDNMLCAGYPAEGKRDSCQVIKENHLNFMQLEKLSFFVGRQRWTAYNNEG